MRLSDLQFPARTVTVPVGEQQVKVTYQPAAVTPALMRSVRDGMPGDEQQTDALARVVTDWDLQGDDGEPLPIDPAQIPAGLGQAIIQTVLQDCLARLQAGGA